MVSFMNENYDVVVVGARCAGSPLALMLARAGLKVCVVDRAGFPSDTLSTHGIQPSGVKVLERLGLLERILAAARPIDDGIFAFDEVRIELPSPLEVEPSALRGAEAGVGE